MTVIPLEPGNRVQLPAEWTEALGIHERVVLDRTDQGILVRRCPPASWEEVFGTKLRIGAAPPANNKDAEEVSGDDFLF